LRCAITNRCAVQPSSTSLGQPPKQLPDDKAVKLAVAADKTAIGYIDESELDATVAVVLELN
jgi:hypothetical protein